LFFIRMHNEALIIAYLRSGVLSSAQRTLAFSVVLG